MVTLAEKARRYGIALVPTHRTVAPTWARANNQLINLRGCPGGCPPGMGNIDITDVLAPAADLVSDVRAKAQRAETALEMAVWLSGAAAVFSFAALFKK